MTLEQLIARDPVPCPHWARPSRCRINLYGGTPSRGVCLMMCEKGPRLKLNGMYEEIPAPGAGQCDRCGGAHTVADCPIDPAYQTSQALVGRCCS